MGSHLVIIGGVWRKNPAKVLRVERDQMIRAFAPDRPTALWGSSPPAFAPVRGFGGGGARRHSNRTKDLDNVTQKVVIKQAQPGRFKAGSSARDAPTQTGRNHCRRHAGNRLAAPLGPWLPG